MHGIDTLSYPHLRNRRTKATHSAHVTIVSHHRSSSDSNVRSRLHHYGLLARLPVIGIRPTPRHSQARLACARAHLRYTRADWVNVLFTDESRWKVMMEENVYTGGLVRDIRRYNVLVSLKTDQRET